MADFLESLSNYGSLFIIPLFGFLLWFIDYRSRKRVDATTGKQYTEALARELAKDAVVKAEKLQEETEILASRRKKEVEDFVNIRIQTLDSDVNHKIEMIYSKFEVLNVIITNIIRDVATTAKSQAEITDKLEKGMDFMKQFMWGRETKSDAPYLTGDTETQEHKEEVGVGIFEPTEEEAQERAEGNLTNESGTSTDAAEGQEKASETKDSNSDVTAS